MYWLKGLIFIVQCCLAIFVLLKSVGHCINTNANVCKVGLISGFIVALINTVGSVLIALV